MVVASSKSVVALLLGGLLCLGPVCVAQQHKTRKSAVKQVEPAPQPTPPPAPLTLEQMPATPPQVTFRQGELTIVAKNSTLGDILRAVRSQTGASVDIPSNATERVVSQLGPAPARDVLALLLNGSHFNYVLLGSVGDPTSLERVILTPKSGGGGGGVDTVAQSVPDSVQPVSSPQQIQMMGANPVDQDADELASDDFAEEPADTEGQVDNAGATQVVDPSQPANGQGAAKTPEQLLQELQQQQQQQQQRMQKLPPGFQIPPNQQPQVPPQPQ